MSIGSRPKGRESPASVWRCPPWRGKPECRTLLQIKDLKSAYPLDTLGSVNRRASKAEMSWKRLHRTILVCAIFALLAARALCRESVELQDQGNQAADYVRTEILYEEGKVILLSDYQERITQTRYRAKGRVKMTYQDILLNCDEVEYDEASREGEATGNVRFSQGKQWFTCSRAEFSFASQTGTFYDASGFTDREIFIEGRTIFKTGRDTYRIQDGFITSCQEKRPKWSLGTSTASIRVDHTARLHHMIFRIKGLPVFYAPYFIFPMEEKKRSSGLLPFRYGNSTSKGRVFSQGYYQTLGSSADATIYGDYFTERGLAVGGIFRARPNPGTRLYLQAYGIRDRLQQGGAQLLIDGESLLESGYRAVARVNITTNFRFRQAFSDTFRSATIPQENSAFFMTRNHRSFSTNMILERDEVYFPERSLIVRKTPSLELSSLGTPIGKTPLIFYLRAAVEGLYRGDSIMETPTIVQRLDLFPRVALRLPALAGFSLVPSLGVRETYYGARITDESRPEIVPRSLFRQYLDFELDLRTPTIEKDFKSSWLGDFKHVVEPVLLYRRIYGIRHLNETLRFDEEDAIADTNEVEYGIVNRIFRSREGGSGIRKEYEFLSLGLMQKYYFDPQFGGAFREGEPNMFYPLYTLTGFSLTGIQRNLAPTSLVARVSPGRGISHDIRADYDTKLQRFRDTSVSSYWRQEKLFVAGTYFKTAALEKGTFESHQLQGQIGYGSTDSGLSASFTFSYNIRTSALLNNHARVNYMWNCCGLSIEFQQFDLGLRKESRLNFSFTLKGIGSFGNIKRPESLF
jgi:LPS-assembly protein